MGSRGNADENSVKRNATLNIFGGGEVRVGDLITEKVKGKTTLNISNVTLNVLDGGGIQGFKYINLGKNVKLNLPENGTLKMESGSILNIADFSGETFISGGMLDIDGVMLDSNSFVVSKAGELKISDSIFNGEFTLSENLKMAMQNNLLYDVSYNGEGKFTVTEKERSSIIDNLINDGASEQEAQTIIAIADTNSSHPVVDAIKQAIQIGNIAIITDAVEVLAPTISRLIMKDAQNVNQGLYDTIGAHMVTSNESSGDAFIDGSIWAQGFYNYSKQNSSSSNTGFTADTNGIVFGIDGKVNESMIIGFGYGYNKIDADSHSRDIDVNGHNFFIYSQYQPETWYVIQCLTMV